MLNLSTVYIASIKVVLAKRKYIKAATLQFGDNDDDYFDNIPPESMDSGVFDAYCDYLQANVLLDGLITNIS
jgi:hypothetical protein